MMLASLEKALLMPLQSQLTTSRLLHVSPGAFKSVSGKYKTTPKRDFPLTYEMANLPHKIAHRKSWNSFNTSNVLGGLRSSETAVEDQFIRKFMSGTWPQVIASELNIIIKRQHNIIRIACIITRSLGPRKVYFLKGYTETLLSYWLQCPVKLELQTIPDKKNIIFKYI